MRFPGGPMIGLLYECCPRPAQPSVDRPIRVESACRGATRLRIDGRIPRQPSPWHGCPPHSLPRPEANRAPDIVDGDLADSLDLLLEQMPPKDVPIQVRPELPRLGISDPRKPVRLRGLDDRTAHVVDIGERLDEDEDCVGLCGSRDDDVIEIDACRLPDDAHLHSVFQIQFLRQPHSDYLLAPASSLGFFIRPPRPRNRRHLLIDCDGPSTPDRWDY